MKRTKGVSLEKVLERQLKDSEIKFHFEERKFYLHVAHLVADLRERAGISQVELAKAAKVSQPLIARLERGDQRRVPTFDTLFRILKALGYRLELSVRPEKRFAA